MKQLIIIMLSYITGACVACGTGSIFSPSPTYNAPKTIMYGVDVDKQLELPVALFLQDCKSRRLDCLQKLSKIKEIKIVDIPDIDTTDNEIVIGLCYDSIFNRRVHINKQIVNFADRYLQALIYHELGHCMYDLDHAEESDRIMSPAMPPLVVLINRWSTMVAELFSSIEERHGL